MRHFAPNVVFWTVVMSLYMLAKKHMRRRHAVWRQTNESRGVAQLTSKHGLAEDAIEGNVVADVAFKLLRITIVRLATGFNRQCLY